MKRGVLFLNGEIKEYEALRRWLGGDDDFVIAVDGGGAHCAALAIRPDLALGDFDSLDPELIARYEDDGVEMLPFPTDKNYIDGALAVEEALRRGCQELLLLGALGGQRIDMELANILMLLNITVPAVIVDANRDVRLLRGGEEITIHDCTGRYLSLIPLLSGVSCAKSTGLLYPLAEQQFAAGESRPLSNEIISPNASVELRDGVALVITQEKRHGL